MMTYETPEFDNAQAFTEGWCISYVGMAFTSHTPFQLEGVCNPDLNADTPFEDNDEGAWSHVVKQANAGSAYHQSALNFLRDHSAEEWADFTARFPVTFGEAA